MEFLVVTSAEGDVMTGNRCTAHQWAEILRDLGHDVRVTDAYGGEEADVLIALHGVRGRAGILAFRRRCPDGRVVVGLTGTDLYPEPDETMPDSLRRADRIVGLQPLVRERVPPDVRDRLRIIVQSARPPRETPDEEGAGPFDVCVVGHLRDIKDPMRAAAASRLLPASSRIRIRHAGAILEAPYRERVEREQRENPRYAWLGALSPEAARELMARCRLMVLSSLHEGGARVLGESIVAGTPVLAARNDAARSLLGDDYEGLFDAGDTGALAGLMARAESDPAFYERLRARTRERAAQFDPRLEKEAWRELVAELALEAGRTSGDR